VDGVDMEALSPVPREESQRSALESAEAIASRVRERGVPAHADVRPGLVVPGILLYAEERDADLILVGGSTRGRVARRVLGDVPLELVQRARRPVMVVAAPGEEARS
jgi:nucleotide-binding universal stress UspA family protein